MNSVIAVVKKKKLAKRFLALIGKNEEQRIIKNHAIILSLTSANILHTFQYLDWIPAAHVP